MKTPFVFSGNEFVDFTICLAFPRAVDKLIGSTLCFSRYAGLGSSIGD
jgi:hypothetical protein